jgi:hypothetical protein
MRPRLQVGLLGLAWGLVAVLGFRRWPIPSAILGSLGAVFLACSAFVPRAALGIHGALKALATAFILLLSWILLGIVFFLVIVPAGWVLRRFGALRTHRGPPKSDTYWTDRPEEPLSVERYLRPF